MASLSKKAYRTETQESTPVERVWYFEHRDGLRFEHLATIEKLNEDGTATLSFTRSGERDREIRTRVKPLSSDSSNGGWVRAHAN